MLKLTNIKKDYATGNEVVHALKGVSLEFRESEFVSILGQSGCGNTTLLNIIGGLDKYTDGDLEINEKSTKKFTDRNWDTYRNHSVGFIFQSYNLIPHQTVLSNVELALTLAGISSAERKARAKAALEKVGLGNQLHKKPNQMSGGQMQRVAIARALVNDPEILLADEPTGALDSETSVQIMDLIKEISKDRLVIMVTHNPELANEYSTRIINLLDGLVISDSNPYDSSTEMAVSKENAEESVENAPVIVEEATKGEAKAENAQKANTPPKKKATNKGKKKQTSMSFFTAFLLSLNNLLTKKSRTILTAFAGSIGIIGIALIFAVSNGTNSYINSVQESTLSSYPLTIQGESVDISALIGTILGGNKDETTPADRENDKVYKDALIAELVDALSKTEVVKNDLTTFKDEIEKALKDKDSKLYKALSEVQYSYDLNLSVYTQNEDGEIIKSDTAVLLQEMLKDFFLESGIMNESEVSSMFGSSDTTSVSSPMFSMGSMTMWQEILSDSKNKKPISDVVKNQYEFADKNGRWPEKENEIVLVLNKDNELDDLTLYALGLLQKSDIDKIIAAAASGKPLEKEEVEPSWSFDEIKSKTYKVILPSDFYVLKEIDGTTYVMDKSKDQNYLNSLYNNAMELKVTGIIRLKDDVDQGYMTGAIGYTNKLTEYVITEAAKSKVIEYQEEHPTVDVLTMLPIKITASKNFNEITDENEKAKAEFEFSLEKLNAFVSYVNTLPDSKKIAVYDKIYSLNKLSEITVDENGNPILLINKKIAEKWAEVGNPRDYLSVAVFMTISDYEKEIYTLSAKIDYDEEHGNGAFDMLALDPTGNGQSLQMYLCAKKLGEEYDFYDSSKFTDKKINEFVTGIVTLVAMQDLNNQAAEELKSVSVYEKITKLNEIIALGQEIINKNGEISDLDKPTISMIANYYDNALTFSESTYKQNLVKLGRAELASPTAIKLYSPTFEQKDDVKSFIDDYNRGKPETQQIKYSDIMGDMMTGITTIINAITYVLIAFVATSLVVSSIMIGVITLISVQERTKEIGVLRAMGASKRDISRVFNAETMIVGLTSGVLGILVTHILSAIINVIIRSLTGIAGLKATLDFWPAIILILISMVLTLIAGLIPSRVAAKKDPVIALRTE